MWRNRRRALLSVIVNVPTHFLLCWCAGAGAALAGVLRAGDFADPVDPAPCRYLRGEEVSHQL